jgi:hypothetical protein
MQASDLRQPVPQQIRYWNQAKSYFQHGLDAWKRIPNPGARTLEPQTGSPVATPSSSHGNWLGPMPLWPGCNLQSRLVPARRDQPDGDRRDLIAETLKPYLTLALSRP